MEKDSKSISTGLMNKKSFPRIMEPIVSLGVRDSSPGKLYKPHGVALNEKNSLIYIAEGLGVSRVSVFSCNGDFVTTFSHREMVCPWGIAICEDSLYVSDMDGDAVFYFTECEGHCQVSKVGSNGSEEGQFKGPNQLAVSNVNGDVYIADEWNHRIQVMDRNLKFRKNISHISLSSPVDVKLNTRKIFVLSCESIQCVHVFNYEGEKLSSLIPQGSGELVYGANFFWIDLMENIIIGDWGTHQIKLFSDAGVLHEVIGEKGEELGMFRFPYGFVLTKDSTLIAVSLNANHVLQIFY